MTQKLLFSDSQVWFLVLSSTFLLNANIKHHVEKYSSSHPEIVKLLIQSIYMDDVVSGADLVHSLTSEGFVTSFPTLQN